MCKAVALRLELAYRHAVSRAVMNNHSPHRSCHGGPTTLPGSAVMRKEPRERDLRLEGFEFVRGSLIPAVLTRKCKT